MHTQRIKHLTFSNPFRTELQPKNNGRVARSWDIVIGRLDNAVPVIDYSTGFKPTASLAKHGIQVCVTCGYLQPIEIIDCKNCGQL